MNFLRLSRLALYFLVAISFAGSGCNSKMALLNHTYRLKKIHDLENGLTFIGLDGKITNNPYAFRGDRYQENGFGMIGLDGKVMDNPYILKGDQGQENGFSVFGVKREKS